VVHQFFCCTDTHGRLPAIPRIAGLALSGTFHAGDIYNGAELTPRDRHEPALNATGWTDPDVAEVAEWIESAGPVYVVRGNHDPADPHKFFRRSEDVTGRVVRISDSLLVAGVGWHGERHYELPGESDIDRVLDAVRHQLRRLVTTRDSLILVTHYPPRCAELFPVAVPESGWWHQCTRAFVEEFRPIAVVQGHVHELRGRTAMLGPSLIVHPGKLGLVLAIDSVQRTASVVGEV